MTPSTSMLIQTWAWTSVALVAAALAASFGLLLAQVDLGAMGLLAMVVLQTLPVVLGALVLAAPVAILAAVGLDQVLPRGPVVEGIRRAVAAAAGVPPVVYGVLGVALLPWLGMGAAVVILAISVLPMLTLRTARIFQRAEPAERMAALALGATPAQVLVHVVGPASARGLLALGLRTAAQLAGLVAPLLLLQPSGQLPLSWQVVERAAAGELGVASVLALGLLVLVLGARLGGALADRRVAWRLP